MDYRRFFGRSSDIVARDLVGRLLIRNTSKGATAGQILEVGAYEGGNETSSRKGMGFGPGRIFLMSYRGNHLLNISTDKTGFPSCVEIRKLGLHDKVLVGSGTVSSYLEISEDFDGLPLGNELVISGESVGKSGLAKLDLESLPNNCVAIYSVKKR